MVHGVVEGAVDVRKDGRKVAELGAGDVGREIALLSRGPRTATVTSTTSTQVLVTDHPVNDRALALAGESDTPSVRRQTLTYLSVRDPLSCGWIDVPSSPLVCDEEQKRGTRQLNVRKANDRGP